MARTGFTDGIKDPIVLFVAAFCKSHSLEVLEFGEKYRINGDLVLVRKQVIALIMAKSPYNYSPYKLDLALTFCETTRPALDPFEALRDRFCGLNTIDSAKAWTLAREAAKFPFIFSPSGKGSPEILDENAANLLCWMAQIKRRLLDEQNLGGLDGVLNCWGVSGSGKSGFTARVLQPIREAKLVEQLASVRKLLDGFHSGALAKKLVLFGDDLNPIPGDMHAPFKAVTTLPYWKIDEKFLKPGEGRIRAGIAISANKPPEEQYRDEAFARRIFNIAWLWEIPLNHRAWFNDEALPQWQVEALWAAAPTSPPAEWRQLVERARKRLYGDGPIKAWFAENCTIVEDPTSPPNLRFLFQQFRSAAEEGNWQVRHITDRIFKKELEGLGVEFLRGKTSVVATNLLYNVGKASSLSLVRPLGEVPEVLK